jgi:hypothetical protein
MIKKILFILFVFAVPFLPSAAPCQPQGEKKLPDYFSEMLDSKDRATRVTAIMLIKELDLPELFERMEKEYKTATGVEKVAIAYTIRRRGEVSDEEYVNIIGLSREVMKDVLYADGLGGRDSYFRAPNSKLVWELVEIARKDKKALSILKEMVDISDGWQAGEIYDNILDIERSQKE